MLVLMDKHFLCLFSLLQYLRLEKNMPWGTLHFVYLIGYKWEINTRKQSKEHRIELKLLTFQ